jgi:AcrR family transcriptional regulator
MIVIGRRTCQFERHVIVEGSSLRELKQHTVREAIGDHAARLILERSFEHTTIEDIARAAGISRRTFFRYFSSKDAVVLWKFDQFGERAAALIATRPSAEPPLRALEQALVQASEFYNRKPAETLAILRLTDSTHALKVELLGQQERWKELFAEALRKRQGLRSGSLRPELIASAGLGTLSIAVRRWLAAPEHPLTKLVHAAFRELRAAFQEPESP